jgi:hypothetical protein
VSKTKKFDPNSTIGDPPPGCVMAAQYQDDGGETTSAFYYYEDFFAGLWSKTWRPAIFRLADKNGVSWVRLGKVIKFNLRNNHPHCQSIAQAVAHAIMGDELDGDARIGAISSAIKICLVAGLFPHTHDAIMAHEKAQELGRARAEARHGRVDYSNIPRWQSIMNNICDSNKGISATKAWSAAEAEAGSKRETMRRHGVTCPIPVRQTKGRSSP